MRKRETEINSKIESSDAQPEWDLQNGTKTKLERWNWERTKTKLERWNWGRNILKHGGWGITVEGTQRRTKASLSSS